MEALNVWGLSDEFPGKYDILSVKDDIDGFKLQLIGSKTGDIIELVYDTIVCYYKSIDESFYVHEINNIISYYGGNFVGENTFFEVELSSSECMKEIRENFPSYDFLSKEFFHLKIIAENYIMDIVSFGPPVFRR